MKLFQCLFGKLTSKSPSNMNSDSYEDVYDDDVAEDDRQYQNMPNEIVMHQHDDVNDIILD